MNGVLVTPGHECKCDDCLRLRGVVIVRGASRIAKPAPRNRFERRHGRKLSTEEIKTTLEHAAETFREINAHWRAGSSR